MVWARPPQGCLRSDDPLKGCIRGGGGRRGEAGRPECGGEWAAKTVKRPPHQPAQPQCASYWAPLTRKRHQQQHRPQRPPEHSDPTRHAKGRTADCPGPCEETATRRTICPQKHSEARGGRPECRGEWAATAEKRPRSDQHNLSTPTTRERENDTSRNAGRSGRRNAATRRGMRREERATVQGPVKKQQTDGMSHRGTVSQERSVQTASRCCWSGREGGGGPGGGGGTQARTRGPVSHGAWLRTSCSVARRLGARTSGGLREAPGPVTEDWEDGDGGSYAFRPQTPPRTRTSGHLRDPTALRRPQVRSEETIDGSPARGARGCVCTDCPPL